MYIFQEIITYLIVGVAAVYVIYQCYRMFIPVKGLNNAGCFGCSDGCALKEINIDNQKGG
jgi:hypothetical protein